MKALVNLLCCFVPSKRKRKEIKRKLVGTKSRRKKLLAYGCKIENEIVTTPEGIKVDISNVPHEGMGITKEVFLQKDYFLSFSHDAVLIDIGMNRGIASLYFSTYPNVIKIYAYEPFKPTFELAQKNLELNPQLSKKITAFNFGLGRKNLELRLPYMSEATGGMSTVFDVCKGEKRTTEETVVIKDAAKEISSILEEIKKEHIIVKCDCEGAEFEIFERLNEENLIGKIDVVLMEYHFKDPDRLIEILTENGFAVYVKCGLKKEAIVGFLYAVKMGKIC